MYIIKNNDPLTNILNLCFVHLKKTNNNKRFLQKYKETVDGLPKYINSNLLNFPLEHHLGLESENILLQTKQEIEEISKYNFRLESKLVRPAIILGFAFLIQEAGGKLDREFFESETFNRLRDWASICEMIHSSSLIHVGFGTNQRMIIWMMQMCVEGKSAFTRSLGWTRPRCHRFISTANGSLISGQIISSFESVELFQIYANIIEELTYVNGPIHLKKGRKPAESIEKYQNRQLVHLDLPNLDEELLQNRSYFFERNAGSRPYFGADSPNEATGL